MTITGILLTTFIIITLGAIISIIKKNKIMSIIFGAIDLMIIAFMLFLIFVLIPAM